MNESIIWEKRLADPLSVILGILRPDWQKPGIDAVLADVRLRDKAPAAIVRAAIKAASNEKIRTPAVIAMDGEHWLDPAAPVSTPLPPMFTQDPPLTPAERAKAAEAKAVALAELQRAREALHTKENEPA